jgi:hypothetical protein
MSRAASLCIDVYFRGQVREPSIEAAIHRWGVRLEAMHLDVQRATIALEPAGNHRTAVALWVLTGDGSRHTVEVVHADPYVAIADAFRSVWKQHLAAPARARACA